MNSEFSVQPIGTNGAFTIKGFNTNYLIKGPSGEFLLDCGATAGAAMSAIERSLSEISCVYLSHLHLDHVGGLIHLGLSRFNSGQEKPQLYAHKDLSRKLWPMFLSAFITRGIGKDGKPGDFHFEDLFELITVPDPAPNFEANFQIAGINCAGIKMEHPASSECHGLILDNRVLITSDTVFLPNLLDSIANHCQIETIFHHCTFNNTLAGMHATADQLRSLPQDLRDLILLSHYDDQMIERNDANFELAVARKVYRF